MKRKKSYLDIPSFLKDKKHFVEKQLDKIPVKEQFQFCFSRENKTTLFKCNGRKVVQ